MCETCGCGESGEFRIHDRHHNHLPEHEHHHDHDHHHDHHYEHDPEHGHHHDNEYGHSHTHEHDGISHTHSHDHPGQKVINLNMDILSENNKLARLNRRFFEGRKVLCLNLVVLRVPARQPFSRRQLKHLSRPGKLLLLKEISRRCSMQTGSKSRVRRLFRSIPVRDAILTREWLSWRFKSWRLNMDQCSLLKMSETWFARLCSIWENLKRVVVISVTEGEDKPLKYPYMFQSSDLCLINKSDLLPYVDFDAEKTISYARSLNPKLEFILVSAKTGEGMDQWFEWLGKQPFGSAQGPGKNE